MTGREMYRGYFWGGRSEFGGVLRKISGVPYCAPVLVRGLAFGCGLGVRLLHGFNGQDGWQESTRMEAFPSMEWGVNISVIFGVY